MAQEVKLMGATYRDVPSVMLPDSANVLHKFIDTSDSTLARADQLPLGVTAYDKTGALLTGTAPDTSHIVADYRLSETALGSDGSVDLSEAIGALTTYSNEVTGESDTTLSAAVGSLADGYGGGGDEAYKFIDGSFSGAYVNNELTGLRNYAFNFYTAHDFSFSSTSVKSLGYNVFQGSNITSFSAPNLTGSTNNANAFNSAKKLTFLDAGSVAKIYTNFAYNAIALTVMVLRRTSVVTLDNVSAFGNTPFRGYNGGTGTIYVPSALISSYKTATNWKTIYDGGACSFVALEGSQYE